MKRLPFFCTIIGLNVAGTFIIAFMETYAATADYTAVRALSVAGIMLAVLIGIAQVWVFKLRSTDAGKPEFWKPYAWVIAANIVFAFIQGLYAGVGGEAYSTMVSSAPPWVNGGYIITALIVGITNLVYFFKPTAELDDFIAKAPYNDIHGAPVTDPAPWDNNEDDELFVTREQIEEVKATIIKPKAYDFSKGV